MLLFNKNILLISLITSNVSKIVKYASYLKSNIFLIPNYANTKDISEPDCLFRKHFKNTHFTKSLGSNSSNSYYTVFIVDFGRIALWLHLKNIMAFYL